MRDQLTACTICGGDGRIENAFGSHSTCPSCHGSGRRQETEGFRDVTKTKPSHHKPVLTKAQVAAQGPRRPTTAAGVLLANEIDKSLKAAEVKARLVRETVEHEDTHGTVTQTFAKKIRKQLR